MERAKEPENNNFPKNQNQKDSGLEEDPTDNLLLIKPLDQLFESEKTVNRLL